ncbi:hypothetical protein GMOD_00010318 [Pyrenophora seminiperda CCB06]|uniref:Uncharacterized protein n=1 Tax=Pyrenophora seminiperda CCB06 TaxID=1302712 RepID=A0A3M7M5E2_9PLEO|nr:hypothetical protein GMOD_00010318 [Pyrenophora seminiperda CCB06]
MVRKLMMVIRACFNDQSCVLQRQLGGCALQFSHCESLETTHATRYCYSSHHDTSSHCVLNLSGIRHDERVACLSLHRNL